MSDQAAGAAGSPTASFRVAFAPGVTPGKWSRIWGERMPRTPLELLPIDERDQLSVLYDGRADMCFVRLPVDRDDLNLIPLYREAPVVVVPKDHVVTAFEEVSVADLADEHLLQDPDEVPEWREIASELRDGTRLDVPDMTIRQAVEVVAAGSGVMILPMSVARLHHRKDVTHRPVTGVAETQIGLAWTGDATDDRVETFIGIVRGRTARSSRGEGASPKAQKGATRKAAKQVPGRGGKRTSGRRGFAPNRGRR